MPNEEALITDNQYSSKILSSIVSPGRAFEINMFKSEVSNNGVSREHVIQEDTDRYGRIWWSERCWLLLAVPEPSLMAVAPYSPEHAGGVAPQNLKNWTDHTVSVYQEKLATLQWSLIQKGKPREEPQLTSAESPPGFAVTLSPTKDKKRRQEFLAFIVSLSSVRHFTVHRTILDFPSPNLALNLKV